MTWSASKSSAVAEVRGEQARAAVAMAARSHRVGAVRQPDCPGLSAIFCDTIIYISLFGDNLKPLDRSDQNHFRVQKKYLVGSILSA